MTGSFGKITNRTLVKKGKQVVLMYRMDGFGVGLDVLKSGAFDEVKIHYQGKVYNADVETYRLYGIPYQREGFEKQIILPRRYFTQRDDENQS